MTDYDAVSRLKKGDLSGLEELVVRYQNKALRVVYLIVQDEPLAEDIVVDTFLRVADRITSFDARQPFEPYLMRSLVHAALNATRSQRSAPDGAADADRLEKLLSSAPSPEELVESSELRAEIQRALVSLSPRQRAVIIQRYYLQMSEREMAQAADAPTGTIKWLLHQARQTLASLLNKQRIE